MEVACRLRARSYYTGINTGTPIPQSAGDGDPTAADQLLVLVYDELRRLAAQRMAREAPGQTLQPTALVHEAWLRLAGAGALQFANRAQFFAAAADAMRRILIERARRRRARRHGGGCEHVDADEVDLACPAESHDQLLEVNDALEKLAVEFPQEAVLVKLRYFVGMTIEEAAQALEIAPRTAKYHWTHARAWLFHELNAASGSAGAAAP